MTAEYIGHVYGTSGTLDFSGFVEPDDALILHARNDGAAFALTIPPGWEEVIDLTGVGVPPQSFVAYRTWEAGDATTQPVQGTHSAVVVYRNVDVGHIGGVTPGATPVVSASGGGFVTISDPHDLAIDVAAHKSSSSFTFEPPPGDTLRYGTVTAGAGIALADTAGQLLTPTTTRFATFTQGGGSPPPGVTYQAMVVLKTLAVIPSAASGWSVG